MTTNTKKLENISTEYYTLANIITIYCIIKNYMLFSIIKVLHSVIYTYSILKYCLDTDIALCCTILRNIDLHTLLF